MNQQNKMKHTSFEHWSIEFEFEFEIEIVLAPWYFCDIFNIWCDGFNSLFRNTNIGMFGDSVDINILL